MKKTHFVAYVTGGLRSGKGLFAIRTIEEFALRDCRIVTNYDLYLENLLPYSKNNIDIIRIPDRPNVQDLEFIGEGYTSDDPQHYDESKFGLIVLDELAAWMNARSWNEKGRKEVIDWLLHSGKRRWSLLLTIQDLEMLDSQFRNATASQLIVSCIRLGDMPLPFITPLVKALTGYRITLPDSRLATIRVGETGIVSDRIFYKGTRFFRAYNTRQEFYQRDDLRCSGTYSYLSPWHLKGRYKIKKDWAYFKKWLSNNVHFLLYLYAFAFACVSASVFASFSAFNATNQLKQSMAMLQTQVSTKFVTPKPVKPIDCKAINATLASFKIFGSSSVSPTQLDYIFVNAAGKHFTNIDFVNLGYSLHHKNGCMVAIVKDGCVVELTCSDRLIPADSSSAGVGQIFK